MNANGDVPKTLPTVKVTDVVGGKRGQISPVPGNTKKVAEKVLKELSSKTISKTDMFTWSIPRLEKAYQRAYDKGDTGQMAQIQAVLNSR
jgi:hypothetical protein